MFVSYVGWPTVLVCRALLLSQDQLHAMATVMQDQELGHEMSSSIREFGEIV